MSRGQPEVWDRDETELWAEISVGRRGDYGEYMAGDDTAQRLFAAGWLESDHTPDERQFLRDSFMDYAIENGWFYDRDEFDWEAWREYMGYE